MSLNIVIMVLTRLSLRSSGYKVFDHCPSLFCENVQTGARSKNSLIRDLVKIFNKFAILEAAAAKWGQNETISLWVPD